MNEIWKAVPGYEGYKVSNFGNVSGLRGWILTPRKTKNGYLTVELYKEGKRKTMRVHRLVYEAFNGTISPGLQANHINEDKTDNRLENLNLMTPKENINWGTRNERVSKPVIARDKQGNFVREFKSVTEAAQWLDIPNAQSNIHTNIIGKYSSAYGYVWEYA